jgi:hypothetical protein
MYLKIVISWIINVKFIGARTIDPERIITIIYALIMLGPFKTVQVESGNINGSINHKGWDRPLSVVAIIPASYFIDRVF